MLIQNYQSKWATDFILIKDILSETLEGIDFSIEHVGSTAVPDLAAKPIIDIDVIYYSKADFEKIKDRFASIGYYHNGDQGIVDREAFKRKGTSPPHKVLDFIMHHLYVCSSESNELKRHLLFRDFLRENEDTRKKYKEIKLQIAEEANQDKGKYSLIKETKAKDFIESIIKKAQQKLL